MITLPKLSGQSYELQDYDVFKESFFSEVGWEVEDLGASSDPSKRIYGLRYGDFKKPTVFVLSSVHGNEWQSAYISQLFRGHLANPPKGFQEIFNILTDKFSFYFIAVGNPYGFQEQKDVGTQFAGRVNANGVDVNRNYGSITQPETVIITETIKRIKPLFFIDNHGTAGVRYLDIADESYRIMAKSAKEATEAQISGEVRWYGSVTAGTSRDWVSKQDSKNGQKIVTFLLEVPGSLDSEVVSFYGLNVMMNMIAYFKVYAESKVQNPTTDDFFNR